MITKALIIIYRCGDSRTCITEYGSGVGWIDLRVEMDHIIRLLLSCCEIHKFSGSNAADAAELARLNEHVWG